jgi:hypothetical protein
VDTSFGDVGKDREITIVVEQEMELDSPLRLAEGGPVKESGAKVDDGGVKAEELFLKRNFFPGAMARYLSRS